MKVDWGHVTQMGLMLGAGVACLLLGQTEAGLLLLGAAGGNAVPKTAVSATVSKLPPFYRKGPGAP